LLTASDATVAGQGTQRKTFDHSSWGKVLKEHVTDGLVDYAAMKKAPTDLNAYLARLATADLRGMDRQEKIALYVNAYNAFTVKLIAEYYPKIESIKDIPDGLFRPRRWKDKRWALAGDTVSLDQIEHDILRKEFDEPRIHVALVCAAMGCPPLRGEPYEGERLDKQLEDQARRFLGNAEKFRIDRAEGVVHLSSILKWFGDDFVKRYGTEARFAGHSRSERAVLNFVSGHLDEADRRYLATGDYDIKYLDYDWLLNLRKSDSAR
jgi:hypothetical protein